MPKGITQEQVNGAAHEIVSAGENPIVGKIRQALGTGSPNKEHGPCWALAGS
jgi:hypothetical protein